VLFQTEDEWDHRQVRRLLLLSLSFVLAASLAACEDHDAHHRFDSADEWAGRFEDPNRDAWQRPEAVLERLELAPDMIVADIGSATGYFPVRIARAVPHGRVYGIDIEPDMVRYLNERAATEGLDNLESVLGAPDDPHLPEAVDLVLMVDTYHHVAKRSEYFRRLSRHLTAGGRVAIVDFKMGELPVGPSDETKIPPDQVVDELGAAGYRVLIDDRVLLPYQYVLVFSRPGR
jgi:ubiquinone/menaquinone biosynthesis C-methylase UbiE